MPVAAFLVLRNIAPSLRWLFLVYPIVSTVAFDAFPCYDFNEEGLFDELLMMQMTGGATVFIGHFFVQGGRSGTVHFVATTTFNRLFIDPVAMLLLWAMGLHWQLCVLEIALGLSGTALTLAAFYDKICARDPETPTTAP